MKLNHVYRSKKKLTKVSIAALYGLISVFLLAADSAPQGNAIDFSEEILKLSAYHFNYLGKSGFAAYDDGDKKLKFFNWQFKKTNEITIRKGEGPGEFKQDIGFACFSRDKIYVNGIFEKKIKVFDTSGNHLKSFPIDIFPWAMTLKDGNLYMVNYAITPNDTSGKSVFTEIVEPDSGKVTGRIFLKDNLYDAKDVMKGLKGLNGQWNMYDVDEKGMIYMLVSPVNTLFLIDNEGKIKKRIRLPFPHDMKVRKVKNGENVSVMIDIRGWYKDMKFIDGNAYACYVKQVSKEKVTGKINCNTIAVKVDESDKISFKEVEGYCLIIGCHKGILYLFNTDDYTIIPIPTEPKTTGKNPSDAAKVWTPVK